MIALALLLCSALPAAEKTDLRFAPAEGSKVRRTITLDHALVVQEIVALTSAGSQTSQNEISFKAHQTLRTLDQYEKTGEGRPQLLQRRFDEVAWSGSFDFPGGKEDIKAQSPLNGTSVVYTWIPEESAYGRYYDARESPEEVLLGLEEDLDLRVLLPKAAVAPGESWSVPAAQLHDVFAPAGRLDWRFEAKKTRQNLLRTLRCGLAGNYGEYFGGESKGECKLTLVSGADAQGRPLATVKLELEFENKVDQRELQQSQLTSTELVSGYKCNKAPVTWKFKGSGTLVWDLAQKRAASLKLEGQQTLVIETELAIGKQPPVGQRMTLSGGLAFDWRIEDPAAPQGQK